VTPLHIAAGRGYRTIVELLLRHGADPNAKDRNGNTPLHYVAHSYMSDLVCLLLSHGADPAQKNAQGKTPEDVAREAGCHSYIDEAAKCQKRGKSYPSLSVKQSQRLTTIIWSFLLHTGHGFIPKKPAPQCLQI
jgi:ankyrin repeat protein